MASLSAEEKVEFLLQVLATGEFNPNYGALATKMGINTNANAQRRLKGVVEADKRFTLQCSRDSTQVLQVGETDTTNSGSDTSKKTPRSTKGRKRTKLNDDKDKIDESPSKVAKKSKKSHSEQVASKGIEGDRVEIAAEEVI